MRRFFSLPRTQSTLRAVIASGGFCLVTTLLVANEPTQDKPGQDTQTQAEDQDSASNQSDRISDHETDESPSMGLIVGGCPGQGVCVMDTIWGSPADDAGIVHGDYILSVNGTDVSSPGELKRVIGKLKSGEDVTVKVWRQGEESEKSVMLAAKADSAPPSHDAWLGVILATNEEGQIVVARVMQNSPAAKAGLRNGDVIVKLEGKDIESLESMIEDIENEGVGSKLKLTTVRSGKEQQIAAELGSMADAPMAFLKGMRNSIGSMQGSMNNTGYEVSDLPPMLEETIDEMRQQIRQLEKDLRQMGEQQKKAEPAQGDVSGTNTRGDLVLVAQRGQRGSRSFRNFSDIGNGRRGYNYGLNNNNYDWRDRYRGGYRSPLSRSPSLGNSYYGFGGRPYYNNGYGRGYGYGRSGIRLGDYGSFWF